MRIRRGLRKHLDNGKKELMKNCKKNALNAFYVVFNSGRTLGRDDAPCYWWLRDLHTRNGVDRKNFVPEYIVSHQRRPSPIYKVSKEAERTFIEYAMHQSPYAGVLAEKFGHVADSRVFVGDCESPANVMLGAFLLLRYTAEDGTSHKAKIWYDLVKQGLDPDRAYVASQMLDTDDYSYKTLRMGAASHTLMSLGYNGRCDDVKAYNYVTRNSVYETEPYKKILTYRKINDRWGDSNTGRGQKIPSINSTMKKAIQEAGNVNVKNNNPFAQVKNVRAKKYDDVIESVKYYMEKEFA